MTIFLSKMDERKMSICPKDKYILSSFYKCDVVLSTYLSVMTSPRKIPGGRIILYIRFIYIYTNVILISHFFGLIKKMENRGHLSHSPLVG